VASELDITHNGMPSQLAGNTILITHSLIFYGWACVKLVATRSSVKHSYRMTKY